MSTVLTGQVWEAEAIKFLKSKGLDFICKNYSCRLGEIDLILQDEDTLIFVEVRYRSASDYGDSAASVVRRKQQKIIRTASMYLLERDLYDKVYCRFDVVAINLVNNLPEIEWIPNAFQ